MGRSVLRVVTYHRVLQRGDVTDTDPSLISAEPAVFERQMEHLATHYRPVAAEEIVSSVREGRALPHRAVLVTFDDAYRDFGEIAWPILRRYGIPPALFVPTAYPDHPERTFWWDRIYQAINSTDRRGFDLAPFGWLRLDDPLARRSTIRAVQRHIKNIPHHAAMSLVESICRELGEARETRSNVLTWDELRMLASTGVTLCAHTRTHPALDQLSVDELRSEIRGGSEDLRRETGTMPSMFAYPFGAHNASVVEVLRQERVVVAVTCLDGHNRIPFPEPLRLRRTNITVRTTPLVFRLRLSPLFAHIDRWRHRQRPGPRSS
jgi:peptidoglycan/xylan/chitin deacetylase (PgdA/CDA1 family)